MAYEVAKYPDDSGWTPKRSHDEIVQLSRLLQQDRSPIIERMLEVQRCYDGDYVVPLPDLKTEPNMPNLTPTLIADVVDGLGMRASSVRPMVYSPAINPASLESTDRAINRKKILNAVYHHSGWLLARRRSMRHINAYETEALVVEPDFRTGMPYLRVRNPLEAYPEKRAAENMCPPEYVAFITRFSGSNLRMRFSAVQAEQGGPITEKDEHQLWDIVEWHDCEQITYGLLGPVQMDGEHVSQGYVQRQGYAGIKLATIRNRTGRCLAFVPQAVSLHTIGNRLNRLLENTKWQNRLLALEIIAQEKAIFPDMYVMSGRNGMQPTLVDGRWHDGREGVINRVEGADRIGMLNQTPDPRTSQTIDRLERNYRVSSGLMPQWGGETGGAALRTGRALGQMADMSVDPRIQELHELDETWMPHVNSAILACYKEWWGKQKYTIFSGWPGDTGLLDFVPDEEIETLDNTVTYAIPGADIIQVTQVIGSLHGSEFMSQRTAQTLHPFIQDPDQERMNIDNEKLDRATIAALEQQVVTGQMPAVVFARIRKMYRESDPPMRLEDVIVKVDEQIREEQLAASQAEMSQQQPELALNAMMGLAAGPAAAAPGMPPGGMPTAPQGAYPTSPVSEMRQLMQAGNPLGG